MNVSYMEDVTRRRMGFRLLGFVSSLFNCRFFFLQYSSALRVKYRAPIVISFLYRANAPTKQTAPYSRKNIYLQVGQVFNK